MKRIINIAALVAACAAVVPLQAQIPNYEFGGAVFNHDIMTTGEFAALSRPQNFGTARSMAMGGAFTSLGADMVSMSLNPAGLGMYRHSEFSFTPLVSIAKATTPGTMPGQLSGSGNSKSRFALANIGAALNVFENAHGALTSVTIGFGMNRIADFNSHYSYSSDVRYSPGNGLVYSIADAFSDQLQKGVNAPGGWQPVMPQPGKDGPNGPLNIDNYGPYFWPAILGYKGAMIEVGNDGRWGRGFIGDNASIQRSMNVLNTGSINEFDLSFGANFNNIVYLGATLGIQSVYKRTEITYAEDYGYFNGTDGFATDAAGNVLGHQLSYADLWQRVKLDGSGVNFKLGVIVRPTPALRLGVAFHTPTFYSLERTYDAEVETEVLDNNDLNAPGEVVHPIAPGVRDGGSDSWDFVSPSRLMFGASYTFGNFAIVSVDYERDWYNGIRVKNVPDMADFGPGYYKTEFKNNFCGTNTVRAGVEVKPLPILALRLGGGYTSSMLKDESLAYEMPLNTESYYLSAGVGVTLSRTVSLDVVYQNQTDKQSRYYLFYTRSNDTGDFVSTTDLYNTKFKRHYISMTLGFRF